MARVHPQTLGLARPQPRSLPELPWAGWRVALEAAHPVGLLPVVREAPGTSVLPAGDNGGMTRRRLYPVSRLCRLRFLLRPPFTEGSVERAIVSSYSIF